MMHRVFAYQAVASACTAMVLAGCTAGSGRSDLLAGAPASIAFPAHTTKSCPAHSVLLSSESQMLLYVRPGDTLSELARCHRSTVAAIMSDNKLTSDKLLANQILAIRFAD